MDEIQADDPGWEVASLGKTLRYLCNEAPHFRHLMQKTLQQFQQLRLVLYCDGITPGNAFTGVHS